tara:strand:- start:2843 stop:4096 length:1254 start_codon:yes stop_codon:yes gene_type:complete
MSISNDIKKNTIYNKKFKDKTFEQTEGVIFESCVLNNVFFKGIHNFDFKYSLGDLITLHDGVFNSCSISKIKEVNINNIEVNGLSLRFCKSEILHYRKASFVNMFNLNVKTLLFSELNRFNSIKQSTIEELIIKKDILNTNFSSENNHIDNFIFEDESVLKNSTFLKTTFGNIEGNGQLLDCAFSEMNFDSKNIKFDLLIEGLVYKDSIIKNSSLKFNNISYFDIHDIQLLNSSLYVNENDGLVISHSFIEDSNIDCKNLTLNYVKFSKLKPSESIKSIRLENCNYSYKDIISNFKPHCSIFISEHDSNDFSIEKIKELNDYFEDMCFIINEKYHLEIENIYNIDSSLFELKYLDTVGEYNINDEIIAFKINKDESITYNSSKKTFLKKGKNMLVIKNDILTKNADFPFENDDIILF